LIFWRKLWARLGILPSRVRMQQGNHPGPGPGSPGPGKSFSSLRHSGNL
jgi:hypothetical protein